MGKRFFDAGRLLLHLIDKWRICEALWLIGRKGEIDQLVSNAATTAVACQEREMAETCGSKK